MSGKTLLLIILAPARDVFASAILWVVIVFPFFSSPPCGLVKYVLASIVAPSPPLLCLSPSRGGGYHRWIWNKLNF